MDWQLIEPYFHDVDHHKGARAEVRWVVEHLQPGGSLLDVGCLGSKFAELMVPHFQKVVGIDLNKAPAPVLYHKLCGDVRYLRTKVPEFDVITFISTLEHVGLMCFGNTHYDACGDITALKACAQMLKDDGKILITVPYTTTGDERYPGSGLWERTYNHDAMWELIHFAGLRIISLNCDSESGIFCAEIVK